MRAPGKFKFAQWSPDQPDLDNPGLIECKNVLPVSRSLVPYKPIIGTGTALPARASFALRAGYAGVGGVYVACSNISGTPTTKLVLGTGAGASSWTDLTAAGLSAAVGMSWFMSQYNAYVIGTNFFNFPVYQIIGSGSNFAQLTGAFGPAPRAGVVGIIGQFVMLGSLQDIALNAVIWSGIDQPLNWPTPGSADAIAQQSGLQFLPAEFGAVQYIAQGDQWGLILMGGGIVRATYTGGSTVFQFDTIARGLGPLSGRASIKVGQFVYFVSLAGFYVTDGTTVKPIGEGRVDNYFAANFDRTFTQVLTCGVNYVQHCIYWIFPTPVSSGVPAEALVYNWDEDRWTHVTDGIQLFVLAEEGSATVVGYEAFDTAQKCGVFSGTPGTATLITSEAELNPGGKAFATGFRPQISGSPSSVSVKVGTRNNQNDAVVMSSASTPDAFTGSANFLLDARYHRAEVDIVGNFTQAIGGEFEAVPSSGI